MTKTAQSIAEHQAREGKVPRKGSQQISGNNEKNTEKSFGRGEHPNSLANLRKFVKGQSGNPSGRPKDVAGMLCRVVVEDSLEDAYWVYGRS